MTRADTQLMAAAALLENVARKLPDAKRHLQREQLILDGMPTTASGADRDPGQGHGQTIRVPQTNEHGHPIYNTNGQPAYDWIPVTGVEATVIRLDTINEHRDDILAHVRGICVMIHNLNRDLDRILGTRLAAVPRCSAENRDGAQLPWPGDGLPPEQRGWADETCHNVPTRGPLCDTCSKREWRWRNARGLTARHDGVFSGEAQVSA